MRSTQDQNCALAQYDQSLRCQLIELVDIIEYIDGQNERWSDCQ